MVTIEIPARGGDDLVDVHRGRDDVSGDDGPVVREALVGVNHLGEVDADLGVDHHVELGVLRDEHREGRGRHDVVVPLRARGVHVEVGEGAGIDGLRELANLHSSHFVGLVGAVRAADGIGIHWHVPTLPEAARRANARARTRTRLVQPRASALRKHRRPGHARLESATGPGVA